MYKAVILSLAFVLSAAQAWPSDHLLYFEGQEIFGYSSALGHTIPYSTSPNSEMQKPSLGFDYLQRFSGESGDVATLALQGRLAVTPLEMGRGYLADGPRALDYEHDGFKTQPQLYNAYLKVRTPWTYVWIGHNRPAFGLSSNLDSHGLLLSTLEMRFGYDRDWGIGANRDLSWGDIAASVTSGSGMGLYASQPGMSFYSHYMTDARVSYGVLNRDNFNLGFSLANGKTLDATGYTLADLTPRPMRLAGADLTILRDNLEHRFDVLAGEWLGADVRALFYRLGINLDEEGRFKIEAQPVYWQVGEERNYQDSLCFSFRATSTLTVRTAYVYDHLSNDNRFLLQLYFYRPI